MAGSICGRLDYTTYIHISAAGCPSAMISRCRGYIYICSFTSSQAVCFYIHLPHWTIHVCRFGSGVGHSLVFYRILTQSPLSVEETSEMTYAYYVCATVIEEERKKKKKRTRRRPCVAAPSASSSCSL